MSGLIYLSSLFVMFGKGIADLEIIPSYCNNAQLLVMFQPFLVLLLLADYFIIKRQSVLTVVV